MLTEQEIAELQHTVRTILGPYGVAAPALDCLIEDWRRLRQTEVWTENFRLWNENDDLRRVAEELAETLYQLANNNGRCDFCCADIVNGEPHDQFCIIPPALASAAKLGIGVKK